MAKPKNLKTLLQLVLEYTETEENYEGLCATIREMLIRGEITDEEWVELEMYFDNNPAQGYYRRFDGYWWTMGNKPPRLRWLKQHIDNLK